MTMQQDSLSSRYMLTYTIKKKQWKIWLSVVCKQVLIFFYDIAVGTISKTPLFGKIWINYKSETLIDALTSEPQHFHEF